MTSVALFGVRSPLLPDYEDCFVRLGLETSIAVRADDLRPRLLGNKTLIDLADLSDAHSGLAFIACAFNPYRRDELVRLALTARLVPAKPIVDPTSTVATSTRLGNGTFVNAGTVIGSAGIIGDHVFINRASNIGHHAIIDDYVSIGPGVTIAGNVRVGRMSFVGAGSIILPGVRIGAAAVVAAGSVVRTDVDDGVLVAGNPAKVRGTRPSPTMLGGDGEE